VQRKAFYSFHYVPDNWRAAKVRSAGVIEGNQPASDNDWERITNQGSPAIQRWIDGQIDGKSVGILLIGSRTAGRKWINYEIRKVWGEKKGLLGIYIHNLTDRDGLQSSKGANPFNISIDQANLSTIVKAYDPPVSESPSVYAYITKNLADWIEEAIDIRARY
jgi:hypothetical protein